MPVRILYKLPENLTTVTIALTSLLAHSTVFSQADLPNNVSFLRIEAQQLQHAATMPGPTRRQ